MRIYGAGIAGLLAGNMFQNAQIFEAGDEGQVQHKALLRFRSQAVADAVGIEFKKVRVNKGISVDGEFCQPNIQLANLYSKKVIGKLADRSIWNLDPVERFIAPDDFITQLAEKCRGRIQWNTSLTSKDIFKNNKPSISTLPISLMLKFYNEANKHYESGIFLQSEAPRFESQPIKVERWRIAGCDVYQTVYFPQQNTNLFRASITGDLLIAEFTNDELGEHNHDHALQLIKRAFGLVNADLSPIEKVNQRYGKIASVDDGWRKAFIHELSAAHNVFSLGRFGTWRNILIDDVLKDISVIKKLQTASCYERSKINAK